MFSAPFLLPSLARSIHKHFYCGPQLSLVRVSSTHFSSTPLGAWTCDSNALMPVARTRYPSFVAVMLAALRQGKLFRRSIPERKTAITLNEPRNRANSRELGQFSGFYRMIKMSHNKHYVNLAGVKVILNPARTDPPQSLPEVPPPHPILTLCPDYFGRIVPPIPCFQKQFCETL